MAAKTKYVFFYCESQYHREPAFGAQKLFWLTMLYAVSLLQEQFPVLWGFHFSYLLCLMCLVHLLSWFLTWVSSCLNICKVKHTSGRDSLNTSKDCVSFKTLKEIKSHNFKEKKPSDIYLPQSWRKASISGVAITRAAILEKGLGVKVAGWGQDVLKVSIHSGMMSKCVARLQTPFFRAGLFFVWRPIWLFFNYWPFYLNCGTTFNCSFYGTCHIPGLIAKFSILKSPIINDIIQPNMLNWILSLRTLISNNSRECKNLWNNMLSIPHT